MIFFNFFKGLQSLSFEGIKFELLEILGQIVDVNDVTFGKGYGSLDFSIK
jgi:hypothetical protein